MQDETRATCDGGAGGDPSSAMLAQNLLRFLMAVRYRKKVVAMTLVVAALLGALYYVTTPRLYSSKAAILVTQVGRDQLNTSMTGEESLRRNTMPTFENMIRSPKVVERALKNLGPDDRVDWKGLSRDRWVEKLQKGLSARTIRGTSIIEVAYTSLDPHVAARVVNAVVQSYVDFMREMHQGTTAELMEQLVKQRTEVGKSLRAIQDQLVEARRQLDDIKFDSETKTLHPLLQRCVFFNDALITLRKQRAEMEASWKSLDEAVRNGQDIGQHLMAFGDVAGREMLMGILGLGPRDSTAQASLEQRLMEDRAALARLRSEVGPKHPELVALRDRIAMTEQFLGGYQDRLQERIAELRKGRLGPWLLEVVRQRLEEIREKEAQLQACYDEARQQAVGLSGHLLHIQGLEREEKRFSDEYDELFRKITELDLRRDGSEVRTAVIEQPEPILRPVSPRLTYVVLLVLVGGFGAGLGLVHLLDALDDRFRSLDEMQNRMGVPVLAMVQQMAAPETVGLAAITMYADPASAESEAFRTLRTALDLAHPDARQIVFSSAEPGDGKTTVSANLAVGYAQSDKKTLLIDADLRRPGLTRMMNLRGVYGLSELLRSEGNIAEQAAIHIQPSGLANLDILPSGPRPPNPHELLLSARFSQLLAWASGVYDHILIDSPPTLLTSDTAIIGRLVDGVVLVVQPAKNRRRLLTRVVESLTLLKIPILGLVINRVGSDADKSYYGYHSGYGYGYGGGYGYGYGYGYGAEEEDELLEEGEEEGAGVAVSDVAEEPPPDADDPEPPARNIRRRAA